MRATAKQMKTIEGLIKNIEAIKPQTDKVPRGIKWAVQQELEHTEATRIIGVLQRSYDYSLGYSDGYKAGWMEWEER